MDYAPRLSESTAAKHRIDSHEALTHALRGTKVPKLGGTERSSKGLLAFPDRTPSVMVCPEWDVRKKTQGCERPMRPSEALAQGPQEPVVVTCDRYCTAGTRMAPHGNLGFLGQKNRKAGESDRHKVTQPSYVRKELMKKLQTSTYWARIYIAGPIEVAKQVMRQDCLRQGLCVTIEPTTYIYSGGEEEGYVVGLNNYPRFSMTEHEIEERAKDLAMRLLEGTFQHSVMVQFEGHTIWYTKREQA